MASEEEIPFNEEECCGDTGYMERLCSAQEILGKVISGSMGFHMSMVCIAYSICYKSIISCKVLVISLWCLVKYFERLPRRIYITFEAKCRLFLSVQHLYFIFKSANSGKDFDAEIE